MGKKAVAAAPALTRTVLNDSSDEVRAVAARAIGRTGVGFDAVGAALFAGLTSKSRTLRNGFIDGLAAYGAPAVAGLAKRLDSTPSPEHEGAAEALYRMGGPAVKQLHGLLEDGTPFQRRAAIGVLLRMRWADKRADTLRGLRACLMDKSAAVRLAAATALGRLARNEALRHRPDPRNEVSSALLAAANDSDSTVRAAVLVSLGQLGVDGARDILAKGQEDKDVAVRAAAFYGAWATGGDAAPALKQLRALLADPAARAAAADALGRMAAAAEPAVEDLVGLLGDEAPETRRAAARALGTIVRPGRTCASCAGSGKSARRRTCARRPSPGCAGSRSTRRRVASGTATSTGASLSLTPA